MSLFSAAEIADLRELDESAMGDACEITHVTQTDDGAGAFVEVTIVTTTYGRLEDTGERARVFLPVDTIVAEQDRVRVSGKVYVALSAPAPRALSSSRVVELNTQIEQAKGAPET